MKSKIRSKVLKISFGTLAVLTFAVAPSFQYSQNSVFADPYQEKIDKLNAGIEENQKKISELSEQGDTLANKLEEIRLETANLQAKIDSNEAKNASLAAQIKEAEVKLDKNKEVLAKSIRKLYIEGDISSLEILASSKSLSDYVDRQEYRDRVKNKISDLTEGVQKIKDEMEAQQKEVGNLLRDQVGMRVDLTSKQGELDKLITETKGQESAYQNQVQADSGEVTRLKKEQQEANAAQIAPRSGGISYVPSSGQANGGYPTYWARASQDSLVDSWGMYNRECVSYTAFKVWQSGRNMPYWGGRGNANRWPSNARNAGIVVDGNPKVGDVAISMVGYYGHAMYVERVNGDGTIMVSQYNYGIRGEYSEMTTSSSGLYFIHF